MKKTFCFLFLFISLSSIAFAQTNFTDLTITLKNKNVGFFENQAINLTSKTTSEIFKSLSDSDGKATFSLPTNDIYEIKIANYTRKKEIRIPDIKGGQITNIFTYSTNMVEIHKKFEMSNSEKKK
ncbi:MAG: hypothetical protein QNK89_08275 [Lacinutrix sp.]|uniref:hypothetical protein n=1 Tax=Lacinutrix sp. TaxID=1937692 RepID=UPI0030AB993E